MSVHDEIRSHAGFDAWDHQSAYVYEPGTGGEDAPFGQRPSKRRKVTDATEHLFTSESYKSSIGFEPLFGGAESEGCMLLREELYERYWSETELRIQSVLDEANEGTLADVSQFVNDSEVYRSDDKLPSAFIVTGPNISSQSLLFNQLSTKLRSEINGPVITLRSGDATNLKSVLKIIIRTATNQLLDEGGLSNDHNVGCKKIVVAFQDSEAFETNILVDLISLFKSWMDRIPFVLLFGVATSIELFQERLSKSATRSLFGIQVDVEQTSSVIERIFQKAVASSSAVLRLGPDVLSILMERQLDHLQSVQSFVAAIKYAYMSHFYGNALSVLCDNSEPADVTRVLEDRHYEAIRTLPSFKKHIERLVRSHESSRIRALLQDDEVLSEEVKQALRSRQKANLQLLRTIHAFQSASDEAIDCVNLYMTVFEGNLQQSDFVKVLLASLKRMAPAQMLTLLSKITAAIREGNPGMNLDGWSFEDEDFLVNIQDVERKILALSNAADEAELPVRSSETIHNKGLRTTVVAQRVQLSYAESTLTAHEKEFLEQNERVSGLLENYFTTDDPRQSLFSEIWLCNSTATLLEAFAPRPRAAVESALCVPDQFLNLEVTINSYPQRTSLHATAVLYQRYLEAGSLINMADLWSSFLEIMVDEEEEPDERAVLMQFYHALADLKSMGMVKQSKKKADHLAKVSWKGL
ncbi:hypothetical protein GLAREA_00387 [Glarea lozoyensis ATCC 20868]|uniref:Origin recognition complex subunit 3 n=1 Tax=Glarea lozoyensis (strain ATCC 20868 / MF5171) TaxID=1116229 RepID=S3CS05_GLAL2|nr:uncharacterized protein GLAREA_00387 [Glarea lozoyensis ATCC 20868]EPE29227.1 hypothetical protein GLAREA_00387 [Glarea lozoyensis ATCC 20868]